MALGGTGVRFWRTCLDEVQMIETPSPKVAKMALRLSTVNRWGVSGTPIQRRGLEDLHGLIAFLQLAPFDARSVWRQCVQLPYERGEMRDKLHGFLRTIMWRTSKVDVVDEIDIPPLHEKTRFLTFSPVEVRHDTRTRTHTRTHSLWGNATCRRTFTRRGWATPCNAPAPYSNA
jgi:E3 ubiquitin-protein ligase SHPRH